MQEQRGLVEQPLGRLDALDDDAARERVQLRVLLRRQLASGEDHHRHIRQRRRSSLMRSSTSKPDMSGSRRSSTTQSHGCSLRAASAAAPVSAVDDVDIVVPEQLPDAQLLGRVVLDDEQALAARRRVRLDRDSAASRPSVVVGLVTNENAPRARPCWRSSSSVTICTGMCRVRDPASAG